jgi:hypothetical protein
MGPSAGSDGPPNLPPVMRGLKVIEDDRKKQLQAAPRE